MLSLSLSPLELSKPGYYQWNPRDLSCYMICGRSCSMVFAGSTGNWNSYFLLLMVDSNFITSFKRSLFGSYRERLAGASYAWIGTIGCGCYSFSSYFMGCLYYFLGYLFYSFFCGSIFTLSSFCLSSFFSFLIYSFFITSVLPAYCPCWSSISSFLSSFFS